MLFSLAEPLRVTMPGLTSVTVVVPRRFVGEDEGDVAGVRGRVLAGTQDPRARLLAAHLVHLGEALETATPAQVDHLVAATLALCHAVLRGLTTAEATGETAGAGGPTALRLAVRRYIEAHPASVDVAVLTRQFRLSRRSLYRLFADTDGVQAYIRERRLAHALRELAKPGTSRRPKLARVAHACGFADPQGFSRAFRKRFGVSPVAVAPGSPALAAGPETGLLGWLCDL